MSASAAAVGHPRTRGGDRIGRFVRALHLWVGLWGALGAVFFGLTGLWLDHRVELKLPQGRTVFSLLELQVPVAKRGTPEVVHRWIARVVADALQHAGDGPGTGGIVPRRADTRMIGCTPATGCVPLSGGGLAGGWSAQYRPAQGVAQVRLMQRSPWASALALHKGGRLGLPWLLLADSLALAMVVLGMSGLVLVWRRPRGRRRVLTMLGLFVSCAVLALSVAA